MCSVLKNRNIVGEATPGEHKSGLTDPSEQIKTVQKKEARHDAPLMSVCVSSASMIPLFERPDLPNAIARMKRMSRAFDLSASSDVGALLWLPWRFGCQGTDAILKFQLF